MCIVDNNAHAYKHIDTTSGSRKQHYSKAVTRGHTDHFRTKSLTLSNVHPNRNPTPAIAMNLDIDKTRMNEHV